MRIWVCGTPRGTEKRYRCPCCNREDDNPDLFAVSMCWDCVFGNFYCEACIKYGVRIDRFSRKHGKSHRFERWIKVEQGDTAVTRCGLLIPYEDLGGSAISPLCRRCWKET